MFYTSLPCVGCEPKASEVGRTTALNKSKTGEAKASWFAQNNLSSKNTTKAVGFQAIDKQGCGL